MLLCLYYFIVVVKTGRGILGSLRPYVKMAASLVLVNLIKVFGLSKPCFENEITKTDVKTSERQVYDDANNYWNRC